MNPLAMLVFALASMAITAFGSAHAAGAADVGAAFAGARYTRVEGGQGVPLNVVEKGDAALPAIVLIHGYRQSHLSWFAQFASTLPERCHLIAFDLRGHGDSGAPWQADGYDNGRPWADDVARVIRATGARRALLVGWSFGGNVAMDFLREHADADIAGLVLVASTGQLLPRPGGPPRALPRVELAERIVAAARSSEAVYGTGVDSGVKSLMASASLRSSSFIDAPTATRALASGNADLLPHLSLPMTLVNGANDAIVPREMVVRLKAALPAARIVDFPNSGHAPFIDDAERFNAVLDALQCRRVP